MRHSKSYGHHPYQPTTSLEEFDNREGIELKIGDDTTYYIRGAWHAISGEIEAMPGLDNHAQNTVPSQIKSRAIFPNCATFKGLPAGY